MKTRLTLVLALAVAPTFGQAPCGSSGLTLTTTPPRLGDPYTITLSGPPNGSGLLGFDTAPGPVATPFGTVCLGLTPAFQHSPIAMDAFGGYTTSGFLPANPALSGFGVFIQAAVADAVQPTGIALSNSVHAVLRAPRVFFIDPGTYATPPAGRWLVYDALTDSAGPVATLPSDVIQAVAVPTLGWIAMILGNGNLMAFNALTGAVTMTVPLTAPGNGVVLKVSGSTVLVLEYTGPNILHFVNLSLATPPVSLPLPVNTFDLIVHSESGTVYTMGASSGLVFPYSIASATQLPPISIAAGVGFGIPTGAWAIHGATIYFLINLGVAMPCGVNAIDTSTNTVLLPAPVPVPHLYGSFYDPLFRIGPGASGPSLFVRDNVSSPGAFLAEMSLQTLAITSIPIAVPSAAFIVIMEPSNGGTEWLLVSCQGCASGSSGGGGPLTLHRMDAATHAVTTVGPLPPGAGSMPLSVLPSGSLNEGYASSSGGVMRFNTDPTTTMIPVPLPLLPNVSVALKVAID